MAEKTEMIDRPAPPSRRPALSPSPLRALQEEMDRIFPAFAMPQRPWMTAGTSDGALGLRVDIAETDSEIEVKADLPGILEKDVEVTLEDDVLRIRAEKKSESETREKAWRVVERSCGVFERSIRSPPELTLRARPVSARRSTCAPSRRAPRRGAA